jgi:GDP-L-fucose synthase
MKKSEIKTVQKIFKPFFKNKKILITGGTGLIGREVLKYLSLSGFKSLKVVSLDKLSLKIPKTKFIYGDLSDLEFCKKITKNIDIVFHLAGIKGSIKVTLSRPASFLVPLVMMNTNILEASRLNKVKRLVYTSSIGAYSENSELVETNNSLGEPMDTYPGHAKRIAELQIQAYKKQFNLKNYYILRPCNVYGPGDNFDKNNAMVIPSLMNKILKSKGKVKVWGDGKSIRDFAYSRDVARAILLTSIRGTGKFKFLNIGSGKGISIKKLVETFHEIVNFKSIFDKNKASGYSKRVLNMKNTKKILNYKPNYSLKEGLLETWKWYKNNSRQSLKRKNYFK